MLEECGLPYRVCPVNLTRGDAKARKGLFGASAGSIANLKEDQPAAEIGKKHEPSSENALRVSGARYYAICRRSHLHATLGRSWRGRHQDRTRTDGRSFKVSGAETAIAYVQEIVLKYELFYEESFQKKSCTRFYT